MKFPWQFAIQLGALLWVLYYPRPRPIQDYFRAQFLYLFPVNLALWLFGVGSFWYALAYGVFTGIILLSMFEVALAYIGSYSALLPAFSIASIFTAIGYVSATRPIHWFAYMGMAESFALTFCGVIVAFRAPYTRHQNVLFTLGMLWIALAAYRLSFYASIGNHLWQQLNFFVPPVLIFAAFSWIAFSSRREI